MLTYAELFAGAGGMSLGLDAAGWTPIGLAEIDADARAVLSRHWPNVPLHGDVSHLNGRHFRGATLLAGGSPCQDLSIAKGKRAGLAGSRSSLFHHQVRIWRESNAPLLLWENVYGAFSSNEGRDFGAVLSAIVGAAVPVAADGWRSAGVAAGPAGVAAWRVLDLQQFGPPQQRRRVFVVGSRTAGVDPAEILAIGESVCGHPPPRGEKGQRNRAAAAARASARRETLHVLNGQHDMFGAPPSLEELTARALAESLREESRLANVVPTVTAKWAKGSGGFAGSETANLVLAAHGEVSPTLVGSLGMSATGHNRDELVVAPTLVTTHFAKHAGCNQHVSELEVMIEALGEPRRLTPLECERLQGWPDGHTEWGTVDGARVRMRDAARYKMTGNGVGAPVAAWIGRRLRDAWERAQ